MKAGSKATTGNGGFAILDVFFIVVILLGGVLLYGVGSRRADLLESRKLLMMELDRITEAVARVAKEESLPPGASVPFARYGAHLSGSKRFRERGTDPFGSAYGDQKAGEPARMNPATAEKLKSL